MTKILLLLISISLFSCIGETKDKGCHYKKNIYAYGESFEDKCNTCNCSKDGISCTKMLCD